MTPRFRRGGRRKVDKETNVLKAFSADHASRVTGLSPVRLSRWDRLGIFSPEYADEGDRGNPYSRVYSYSDLVGLRTVAILIDKHRVPMSEIKRAYAELERRWDKPWSQVSLGVLKRKIVFDLDTAPRHVTTGQYVLKHIPIESIAEEIATRAEELRHRRADQIGQVERRKYVAHNALVLAGTRIPVAAIQSFIGDGYTDEAIVEEYPTLTVEDVQAVRSMKDAA